ncbi:MAG: hypothetical protein M1541_18500 [Acidobacteria bacterium]|nr:hypothetical protein [Acidobacteriota bacterium]
MPGVFRQLLQSVERVLQVIKHSKENSQAISFPAERELRVEIHRVQFDVRIQLRFQAANAPHAVEIGAGEIDGLDPASQRFQEEGHVSVSAADVQYGAGADKLRQALTLHLKQPVDETEASERTVRIPWNICYPCLYLVQTALKREGLTFHRAAAFQECVQHIVPAVFVIILSKSRSADARPAVPEPP